MAYNPISLNVILQALRHMTFPKPLKATASSSVIASENGTIMRQMTLTFDRWKLHQHIKALNMSDEVPRTDAIRRAVQECFCDDIRVFYAAYEPSTSNVIVELLCSITAHD